MKSEDIFVSDCRLCEIYTKDKLPKKIYFLSHEFLIFQDEESNMAMVSTKNHVNGTSRDLWGRILYRVRKQFGQNIKLIKKPSRQYPDDHWHLYVTIIESKSFDY